MSGESDRLSRVEKEVEELKQSLKKISEEFSRTVEELKKAVVEIRSAVTEIENPFNLLRVISSEEELQRARRLAEQVPVSPVRPAEAVEKPVEKPSEKPLEKPVEKPLEEEARRIVEAKPTSFEAGFSIIKWVWALLDAGLDKDDVVNISKYCERVGYLPPRSSEYVGYVVDAMSKARLGGLNLEEFMLIIYGAAKASGLRLEMKELEEVAFSLLRKILKKIDTGHGGG
jgi:hypothetical protein